MVYERAENSELQQDTATHLLSLHEMQSVLKCISFKESQIGLIKLVITFTLHVTILSVPVC